MQQDLWQHYNTVSPGQVQVLGVDLWNGTASGLNSFKTQTGATYPLLLNGATATGGNVSTLYGTYDNYVVLNKQGIVRYHAALAWPHGNRYHLNEIRATVDSLVAGFLDAPPTRPSSFAIAASPNPVRGRTTITLALPRDEQHVRVSVRQFEWPFRVNRARRQTAIFARSVPV